MKRFLPLFLIFTLAVTIFVSCRERSAAVPEIITTSDELAADYERDEQSAQAKYEGKTILITGRVSHFALIRETAGVYFKARNGSDWTVMCLINTDDNPGAYQHLSNQDFDFIGISRKVENKPFIQLSDCRFADKPGIEH